MDVSSRGAKRLPFPSTPDTASWYPSTGHERALARLLRGVQSGEGLMLVVGRPGVGKTLLGHCLLERLGSRHRSALLTNTHLRDRISLLQAILFDLSIPYEGRAEQEMRLALTDHLLRTCATAQSLVLVVDEAQHLTTDLLEELRLLGNLEARGRKALQVVLLGQPGILEALERPELAALRQRLAVRVHLEPLDVQEAADYLLHHLRAAGRTPEQILSDEPLDLMVRATGGVPRLLNQVARQALALAEEAQLDALEVEVVLEALHLVGLEAPLQEPEDAVPARSAGNGAGRPGPMLPINAIADPACDPEDYPCRLYPMQHHPEPRCG
jgi:type II secretory pathway predicted ATPase ExeA